ncbi:hypothetical protein HYT52_00310 [Candidatus Woesearchaeota archaeon]|nr:hypothetical protein [Candidatus Woesearchaeota archaeon]
MWRSFSEVVARKDLKQLSNKELLKILDQFYQLHLGAGSFAAFIRMIIHRGVPEFERILRGKVPVEKLQHYLIVLTSTTKESFNGEEELALFNLAFTLLKRKVNFNNLSSKDQNLIDEHRKKFSWIPCGYYDEEPHNQEYYLHRIRRIAKNPEEAKKTLEKMKSLGRDLAFEQERIKQELKFNQEELNLMECLQECVYYKDFVRGALNYGYYQLYPFFTELGKRAQLSMLTVKFLFRDEIKEPLEGKDFSDVIKKRMDFCVIYLEKDVMRILYDLEAEKMAREITGEKEKEVSELIGRCAHPGYAKARARVLRNPQDIQNETHDFILIASMTTPEFVVAVQKALAIVTDEGGITCHAAIVAREMNKPCVIGTKIATKVFKDGDIVEVDAEKGIVRKVNP